MSYVPTQFHNVVENKISKIFLYLKLYLKVKDKSGTGDTLLV